jgi:NAD(P)H-dependent FMN reductase
MAASIQVVGVCGSLRPGSYTRLALRTALRGAAELGAETDLIDLGAHELVFCTGAKDEPSYPEGVRRLRQRLQSSQGIILGTPVYHGSFSGVLKNALDLTGFPEFEGKMVGLVGVSGGRTGAIHALDGLRVIGRVLHAWVIPEQVSIPQAWKAFDAAGNLVDPELEGRLLEVGRQVARFSYLHTSDHAQEFLQAWETALPNPGADHD